MVGEAISVVEDFYNERGLTPQEKALMTRAGVSTHLSLYAVDSFCKNELGEICVMFMEKQGIEAFDNQKMAEEIFYKI